MVEQTADLFDSVDRARTAVIQIRAALDRGTPHLIEAKRMFPTEEEKVAQLRQSEDYWQQRRLESSYLREKQKEQGGNFGRRSDPDGERLRPCPRCDGQGFIFQYRSFDDGACFQCRGTGTIRKFSVY